MHRAATSIASASDYASLEKDEADQLFYTSTKNKEVGTGSNEHIGWSVAGKAA